MSKAGHSTAAIATHVGRSPRAVESKLVKLRRKGMKIPHMYKKPVLFHVIDEARINHLVKRVMKRAKTEGYSLTRLAKRSGVADRTIANWAHDNPQIHNFEAVANSVGYRLVLIDDEGREAA